MDQKRIMGALQTVADENGVTLDTVMEEIEKWEWNPKPHWCTDGGMPFHVRGTDRRWWSWWTIWSDKSCAVV